MKSKAEIAQEHHMIQHGLSVGKAQSHADFTLEYSEQIAIGFAEWINKTGIETTLRGEWIDFRTSPSSRYTSAELYNLYKQTLK